MISPSRPTLRRRILLSATLALATSTIAATLPAQQVVVDTRNGTYPGQVCCISTPYPDPSSAPNGGAFFTIGQVFQVSSPTHLTDFTFWLLPNAGTGVQYQAYIAPWDAAGHRLASATPTWTGSTYTTTSAWPAQTMFGISGGVDLAAGTPYMAFLSVVTPTGTVPQTSAGPSWNHGASNFQLNLIDDGSQSAWRFVSYPSDVYPYSYGSYWNALSHGTWDSYSFSTEFVARGDVAPVTTTPEPSGLALLGTGLVGLVPMLRRKRA